MIKFQEKLFRTIQPASGTKVALYCPEDYREYYLNQPEVVRRVVNGCGTDGWKGDLVPETVWGLSIAEACNIHDWMYMTGETAEDKELADRVFLYNMQRIVEAGTSLKIVKWARLRRVKKYYLAVHYFGGPAFWNEKNKAEASVFIEVGKNKLAMSPA